LHQQSGELVRAFALAVLLLVIGARPAAAETVPDSSMVTEWKVAAYTDNGSGAYSHCAMVAKYRSGATTIFAVSHDHSWRVGWSHPGWRLEPGQSVNLALVIDGANAHNVVATARDRSTATAELPDSVDLFHLLRKGHRLTAYAQGKRYDFILDGAALTEVGNCVSQYRIAATASACAGHGQLTTEQKPDAATMVGARPMA
jgi:hypothetical protein